LTFLLMARSRQQCWVRVDQLGLVEECRIAAVSTRPAGWERRQYKVLGAPEVKGLPGGIEDRLPGLDAKCWRVLRIDRAISGFEEFAKIGATRFALIVQDVVDAMEQPQSGLDSVDLPVDQLAQSLIRGGCRPANWNPGAQAMNPEWTGFSFGLRCGANSLQ